MFDIQEEVIAVCSECRELSEWIIIAVNPIDDKSAERVWECTNCGHEDTEVI